MKVAQSCLTLCDPMDYRVRGILQARMLEWEPFPSPGDFPNPGTEPRSPALQADSLPAESPVKPKITGVGSLSLFQQIFPTQELNQGLLHCKQILYQLTRILMGTEQTLYMGQESMYTAKKRKLGMAKWRWPRSNS